jgi:hypothetical protein
MLFTSSEDRNEDEDELAELEGQELVQSLGRELENELRMHSWASSQYGSLKMKQTREEWKRAERNRRLGYNGRSERTKRRHDAEARKKEKEDIQFRNR